MAKRRHASRLVNRYFEKDEARNDGVDLKDPSSSDDISINTDACAEELYILLQTEADMQGLTDIPLCKIPKDIMKVCADSK